VDLPAAVVADPERAFRPGEAGIAAVAGGGDAGEDFSGRRLDPQDAVLGDLVEMAPVEGGAGMGGDVDRPHQRAALGIDGIERFSGGEPEVLAVVGDAVHLLHAGKGAVFAKDMGFCLAHGCLLGLILAARQGTGE